MMLLLVMMMEGGGGGGVTDNGGGGLFVISRGADQGHGPCTTTILWYVRIICIWMHTRTRTQYGVGPSRGRYTSRYDDVP